MFNILVVDDQAHIRRLYEYTLEKNGYQPTPPETARRR